MTQTILTNCYNVSSSALFSQISNYTLEHSCDLDTWQYKICICGNNLCLFISKIFLLGFLSKNFNESECQDCQLETFQKSYCKCLIWSQLVFCSRVKSEDSEGSEL